MWWLYFRRDGKTVAVAIMKHRRFITRARAWLFAGLARLRITATRKSSMTEMRHWFLQIA
jgi:hypothetical protein